MMEEAVPRVPLQTIAEHTKIILGNCPVLKILSVRQEYQANNDSNPRPVIPRTGISLQHLMDMEWACSKTIQFLELEIWDPPTPGPAAWTRRPPSAESMDDSLHHTDGDDPPSLFKDASIKEGKDAIHLDEEIMFRPYADEETYLDDCRLFSRWKSILYAKHEAHVDVWTAAEAASLPA